MQQQVNKGSLWYQSTEWVRAPNYPNGWEILLQTFPANRIKHTHKNFLKNIFCWRPGGHWRKVQDPGGSGAGSVSQRYWSEDPDPCQYCTDPEHWRKVRLERKKLPGTPSKIPKSSKLERPSRYMRRKIWYRCRIFVKKFECPKWVPYQ